jgi:ABC-type sugar transport system substrate-binding protein
MLCNTRVPGAQVLSYVGVDFRESAYRASKYTLEKMGGKGKIVHLTGVLGSQTGMDIKAGTEDAIKEYPGITVLATETAGFVRPKGMEVMENLLQRFPKIDAVLVANDASGLGVVEAIKQAGRMKDGMLVTGVLGGVDEGIIAVAKGEFLCVDYQAPYDEGYWATVLAYFALPGVSKNRLVMDLPSDVMIPCKLVTKDNVEVYMKKLGLSLTK